MGFKKYNGLAELPEVIELIDVLKVRKYTLLWSDDSGLRMQKWHTEIHLIPEKDRLRLCIHDDGMEEKETTEAKNIAQEIFLKYGYKQGVNTLDPEGAYIESEDEMYKYF